MTQTIEGQDVGGGACVGVLGVCKTEMHCCVEISPSCIPNFVVAIVRSGRQK